MKNLYSTGALVLLAVLFVVLTMLGWLLFKNLRVDLTENKLYTLSDGTVNILESLEDPVTLRLYFSDTASEDLPQIRRYADRVWELMQEMESRADGRLDIVRIDPVPFSEQEDDAARYGLEAVPLSQAGDVLYLGVVGTNRIDGLEVLPFASPQRERFLEYDLARMISALATPDRSKVGLISGLPITGGMNPATGQQQPSWAIHDQWTQLFDVQSVQPTASALPADLDALILVHPKQLSEGLMRDIDQFVLGGGRLLAFVDPYAETDPGDNPMDPAARFMAERTSSLPQLFEAWGIGFDVEQFVADPGRALQVTLQPGQPPVRHPAILGITRDDMAGDDLVTAQLETVNVASAGAFDLAALADGLEAIPLIESSASAGLLPAERLRMAADPSTLLDELGNEGTTRTLAVRLSGTAGTAWPDTADENWRREGPVNAVLVADTDLLADALWVQRQRFLGQVLLEPFADNGAMAVNAVENLLGDANLISIRGRATSDRPFGLVDDLRREAEARLRATEQQLEAELRETEAQLTELQQARGDADLSILTPEQEAAIDRFMDQRLEIRRELRQVRRELDKDIEALGGRIKVINIALMPLLVTLVALAVAWRRRRVQHEGGRR
jgi:ABC-type uncharacterized transport system involved in gliding motility auxiliary subunit